MAALGVDDLLGAIQSAIEARFYGLLNSLPDAVLLVDATGHTLLANAQAEQLFGYAPAALVGQRVEVLVPERVRTAHAQHRANYVVDPRTRSMGAGLALFGRRRDGTEFPVEISLSPLYTERGTLTVSATRDVTASRQAEAKFRGLLESAPDAMVTVNRDGRIVLANTQAERLFGYPREELLGGSLERERSPKASTASMLATG